MFERGELVLGIKLRTGAVAAWDQIPHWAPWSACVKVNTTWRQACGLGQSTTNEHLFQASPLLHVTIQPHTHTEAPSNDLYVPNIHTVLLLKSNSQPISPFNYWPNFLLASCTNPYTYHLLILRWPFWLLPFNLFLIQPRECEFTQLSPPRVWFVELLWDVFGKTPLLLPAVKGYT